MCTIDSPFQHNLYILGRVHMDSGEDCKVLTELVLKTLLPEIHQLHQSHEPTLQLTIKILQCHLSFQGSGTVQEAY